MILKPLLGAVALSIASMTGAQPSAPERAVGAFASGPIDGQYIVVFKKDVQQPRALTAELASRHGAQVIHQYGRAVQGFSARMSPQAAEALKRNPNVADVEQDATVSLRETRIEPAVQQPNPTWGLDRIDQRSPSVSGAYGYQYVGTGVHAFVIDTGILSSHQEFQGRLLPGYTAISDGVGTSDCDGHGTHVAGTIGGSVYGVAKGVALVPVRVLDCGGSGTWSGVIAGVDWVAAQDAMRPAVANMSLGGGKSSTVNAAVAGAVAAGVTMVVAAGNSNADACKYSPASEPAAITVGATAPGTSGDPRASYSNFGSCLDVFAPGTSITSAWSTGTSAINTISGTSMASPHVAGVAALALAANPQATPKAVSDFLLANATTGTISSAGSGSPNRMIFSLAAGAPATAVVRTVAVSALTGQGVKSGSGWRARATVTIRDHDGNGFGNAVSGATVTGSFSPGGNASCVTGSTGQCALSSATLSRSTTTTAFTVSGVAGADLVYDATRNAASSVSISRP